MDQFIYFFLLERRLFLISQAIFFFHTGISCMYKVFRDAFVAKDETELYRFIKKKWWNENPVTLPSSVF